MSVHIIVTGDAKLDLALAQLDTRAQKRIARPAVIRAMTFLKKKIKKAAPVGPTGNLKKSIGSRFKKSRGVTQGKVGIDVGEAAKRKYDVSAPHGHLVALGTQQRTTESGANRGKMPANDFVSDTIDGNWGATQALMKRVIEEKLEKELQKLGFRG